jgi:hypothetical protein
MRVVYRKLFRLRTRHGWYAQGVSSDFSVTPTPSTRALLEARGFLIRPEPDGLSLFAEVEPDSEPAHLLRSLAGDALKLSFALQLKNSQLFNATALTGLSPARSLFVFDNLRVDVSSNHKLLGDSQAGVRLGPAVDLVTSGTFSHVFLQPVARATLTLRDRFGLLVATQAVAAPPGQALQEWRFALDGLPKLGTGRYTLSDDHGKVTPFYFAPELSALRPLGVIEIFSRTEPFTSDASNQVPPSYRFLVGDTLTELDGYSVQLEPRSTRWRYIFTKAYPTNGIALAKLSISGSVAFAAPTIDATRAVFRATAPVPLSETPRGLKLLHDGRALRALPEPDRSTPVGKELATGDEISDVFVNV